MRWPRWYRTLPQPARWTVAGALPLAGVGITYGIVESVTDYPVGSWFGVTLYVGLLATLAGAALGVIAGSVAAVYRRRRAR